VFRLVLQVTLTNIALKSNLLWVHAIATYFVAAIVMRVGTPPFPELPLSLKGSAGAHRAKRRILHSALHQTESSHQFLVSVRRCRARKTGAAVSSG